MTKGTVFVNNALFCCIAFERSNSHYECSCIIFCHLRVVHYCVIPRQFKNCHACSFLTHLAWCSVEKQARKDSGSVEQVNYCMNILESIIM